MAQTSPEAAEASATGGKGQEAGEQNAAVLGHVRS